MKQAEKDQLFECAMEWVLQDPDVLRQQHDAGCSTQDLKQLLDDRREQLWDSMKAYVEPVDRVDRALETIRELLICEVALEDPLLVTSGGVEAATEAITEGEPTVGRGTRGRRASRVKEAQEADPDSRELLRRREEEVRRLEVSLAKRRMLPLLRTWMADCRKQETRAAYREDLSIPNNAVLRGDPDVETLHEENASRERLQRTLQRLRQGSVGLAGPRGSGKSTILKLECSGSTPDLLRVKVDAPAHYDPREFLLSLFSLVCKEVLSAAGERFTTVDDDSDSLSPSRHSIMEVLRFIALPALAGMVGLVLVLQFVARFGVTDTARAIPVAVAALATSVSCGIATLRRPLIGKVVDRLPAAQRSHATQRSRSRAHHGRRWYAVVAYTFFVGTTLILGTLPALPWLTVRRSVALVLLATGIAVVLARFELLHRRASDVLNRGLDGAAFCAALFGCGLLLPTSLFDPDARLIAGSVLVALGSTMLAEDSSWRSALSSAPTAVTSDDVSQYAKMQDGGSRSSHERKELLKLAREGLRRFEYQRTVATGWTSAVRLGASTYVPVGVDNTATATTTEVEVAWTTPEIIRRIEDLLARQDGAIIGIDELDQLESEDKARAFLHDIKGLFSAKSTRFLVSMSEDAIASFERRGLPFRDVFDSAFDEVVRVSYFTYPESKELIRRRAGQDAAPPFIALAHCLSGGLARDLIRTLDHMVEHSLFTGRRQFRSVASGVVHRDLESKYLGTRAAIRPIPLEPQVTEVITALYRLDRCSPGIAQQDPTKCLQRPDWLNQISRVHLSPLGMSNSDVEALRALQRLTGEYLAFAYFCRTLLEFFDITSDAGLARLWKAEEAPGTERISLDYLARARQHLTINPHLAWEMISNFREQALWEVAPTSRRLEFPPNLLTRNTSEGDEVALAERVARLETLVLGERSPSPAAEQNAAHGGAHGVQDGQPGAAAAHRMTPLDLWGGCA